MNADTLASLQVLQLESSPNVHSHGPTGASSGSKEGLSVYGLFHHLARTPQGKSLLRQYFLRPILDMDVINERLETASVFLRPDNDASMNSIVKNLGQIKNMKTVTLHLRKGINNGSSKGGGIKSGIWSSLRSVRCFERWKTLLICPVRFSYFTNKRCFEGGHWRRQTCNSHKSLFNSTVFVGILIQFVRSSTSSIPMILRMLAE